MLNNKENIPPGYKPSPLGPIPANWDVKEFGEFVEITMGQSPEGSTYNNSGNGIALINGPTEFTEKYPVKVQWTTSPTKMCKEGDILLCVRGSSTGRINIANESYCIGRGVAAIRAKKNSDHSFLEFQIQNVVSKILGLTVGSTFPNIDSKSLRSIEVLLPRLSEQTAIANLLSTWDKAIQTITQLIAQKEQRKKWLMQQLLTGKKRLKGFSGEWKKVKLSDLFKLSSGETKPIDVSNIKTNEYLFPVYGGNGIMAFSKAFHLEGDKIIIGRVGEYCGITRKISGKYWITDNALYTTEFSEELSINFLTYKLIYEDLSKLRNKGGQPLISQKPIYSKTINRPPIEEQTAIAVVLQASDKEIQLMKAKAEQLKEQKKGLMQILLTGKKRLKI